MNRFGFKQDEKIIDTIKHSDFTLSAEVIPPRNGAEQEKVMNQIQDLVKAGSQFLSVTKGAGGSLRGGSLPIAQSIKEQFGVPCIAHFTCRDLTPQEVENQLMDHHYFGIRNILALRGDPPAGQAQWKAKEGSHNYAHELIQQIKNLNQGKYLLRPDGPKATDQTKTDFCIGAAVYPEHANAQERVDFFKAKIDAGAEYAITQMVFDDRAYGDFLELCSKNQINVPILVGTRILKSKKQALNMSSRFGVSIPKSAIDTLPEKSSPDTLHQSIDIFLQFVDRLKSLGAPGIHLFVLSDTEISTMTLKKL